MQFFDCYDLEMPRSGSVSLTLPWGATVTITCAGASTRDLAATSAQWRYSIANSYGDEWRTGEITAIGGLSGSWESCYYPQVRRLLDRTYQAVELYTKRDGVYFPDTKSALAAVSERNDHVIVAVGGKLLPVPHKLECPFRLGQDFYKHTRYELAPSDFDALVAGY
jgi:hypothetical protein